MSSGTQNCCHCCKNCYPDSLMNSECQICPRLGRKCKYGHGKCNPETTTPYTSQHKIVSKSGIHSRLTKNSELIKVGSSIHGVNTKHPRFFGSRPLSSTKGPIKHTVGPALPFELSTPHKSYSKMTSFPTPQSVTIPLKQNRIVNNTYVVEPLYYDYELKIPIQKLDPYPIRSARKFFEDTKNIPHGESIKTNKTGDTMINSKVVSQFTIDNLNRKIRRQPMTPKDLMKMVKSSTSHK